MNHIPDPDDDFAGTGGSFGDGEPNEEYPEEARESEHNDEDDFYDDDNEPDEIEEAMDNCGEIPGGGCMLAGTEHCEFDCPFSAQMYRNLSLKRDSKGRFSK